MLDGRDERLEVEKRRGRGPAERAEFVLVVQPVPAHGGQLPALGHEHDEQDERGRGAQAQRQAPVLVARLRGPQPGHGPSHAQGRRATDGQPDVHGLAVVVADAPGLDGQHGDGQQQTGRVHQRAERVLVLGVAAVVQAVGPLKTFTLPREYAPRELRANGNIRPRTLSSDEPSYRRNNKRPSDENVRTNDSARAAQHLLETTTVAGASR